MMMLAAFLMILVAYCDDMEGKLQPVFLKALHNTFQAAVCPDCFTVPVRMEKVSMLSVMALLTVLSLTVFFFFDNSDSLTTYLLHMV